MVVTFSLTQAQLPPANGVCPVSPHGPLEAMVIGEGTEPQAAVTSVIVPCLGTRPVSVQLCVWGQLCVPALS